MKRVLFVTIVTAVFLNWAYAQLATNAHVGGVARMQAIDKAIDGE